MNQAEIPLIMSQETKRAHAHELIDQMDNEFFDAIYQLMETYVRKQSDQIMGYSPKGEPVYVSKFLEEAEEQIRRAKAGEGISVEELKKRSAQWLARSK
ncbi:MAG TPA: hypothetical protein PKA00_04660 [Saprospiraceae bacterium]|nr:hypothetical protein [Saprospiraceae bacterium]